MTTMQIAVKTDHEVKAVVSRRVNLTIQYSIDLF